MAELFGIDIAQVIADEIEKAGNLRPGTLTKVTAGTRTGGDLIDGTNPTETTHTFQGFVETRTKRRAGTLVSDPMSVVSILGASIDPAVVPEPTDEATIDGGVWTLVELISRDPAAAMYEFKAES